MTSPYLTGLKSRLVRGTSVVLASVLLLQGCAVAVVGAGALGVKAVTDRRSIGTQLDDQTLEFRAQRAISEAEDLGATRVVAVAYNETVLLVGQALSQERKTQAERLVRQQDGIDQVHNEIRIGNPISITTRTHDSWLTSKVKTKLLSDEQLDGSQIKVITENGEVFLMGLVGGEEAERAIEIARNISGVKRVVTAFTSPP